jgi:hypothetical protein
MDESPRLKAKLSSVMPAQAGIQARADTQVRPYGKDLDSRFRGNDAKETIDSDSTLSKCLGERQIHVQLQIQ